MKLASYIHAGRISFGVLSDRGIGDVPSRWPEGPRTLLEAIQAGPSALDKIRTLAEKTSSPVLSPEEIMLQAPIANPPKLMGLAGNYVKHLQESNLAKGLSDSPATDTTPRPFLMPPTAVANPGERIPWPAYSREIDYEIELAIVIGKRAKGLSPEEARDVIFGYTIANDVSARSVTHAEGRAPRPWDEFYDWLHGKWADGFCPLGPVIVTADEIGDPNRLNLELTVNGKIRQQANTGWMIFDVYEIVSFLSQLMTLTPGDIIATGTPSGVGMADGNYLHEGDVITCRIDGIGELTNTLAAPPTRFYTPCRCRKN